MHAIVDNTQRMTVGSVARHLCLTRHTVERWIRTGYKGHRLPARRTGRKLFIDPTELEAFLQTIEELGA